MLRKFRVSTSRKFIRAGQFGQGAWKFIPAGRSAFAYPAQNVRAMLRAAAAALKQRWHLRWWASSLSRPPSNRMLPVTRHCGDEGRLGRVTAG